MAEDLRSPQARVRTDIVHEPTIRLSLFTQRGTERGTDLTPDEAVTLAHALLGAVRSRRRLVVEREQAAAARERARREVESRG